MDAQLFKKLSVLVLLLFMLGIDNGYAQQSVTCDAGTAYIGESANVTCYYHKDIGANKLSVNVAMVPTTPGEDKEERDVIQCSWTKQDDKPQCLVAVGYTFNDKVTDRLTVDIQYTTPRFAGVYSCRIVPPDDATVDTCTLVVKDENTGTAILILVIILIFLAIGIIVHYAWRRKWIHRCISQVLRGVCPVKPENPGARIDVETAQPDAAQDTARGTTAQSRDVHEESKSLLDSTKEASAPVGQTDGPPAPIADKRNYENRPTPPPRIKSSS